MKPYVSQLRSSRTPDSDSWHSLEVLWVKSAQKPVPRSLFFEMLVVLLVSLLCGCAMSKECTNVPTQLSSHSLRYELLSSNNETWKEEMFSHYHLIPTDDSAWSNLLPRKVLREEDEYSWAMMYRKMKNQVALSFLEIFLRKFRCMMWDWTQIQCMEEHSKQIWNTYCCWMRIAWFGALGRQLDCQHLAMHMGAGRNQIVSFGAIL